METMDSLLGPGGVVSRRWGQFESRPQQVEMATAVARALARGEKLLVEAGTGVGKSFAYLVPAVQAIAAAVAAKEKFRVVVSTHTIGLQEQILTRDIPFLQSVLPFEFRAALVKGRGNYLSLRRLRVAQQRAGGLLDQTAATQLLQIGKWSRTTKDGSRADLPVPVLPGVWDLAESDSGNCLGRACPNHAECFYSKARKAAFGAELLIVNHALFFSDLALRKQGGGLLPDYNAVIFDEAHTLEDVAADFLGLSVGQGGVDYLLNQLLAARSNKGILAVHGDPESFQQLEATRFAADRFFGSLHQWLSSQPRATGRVRQPSLVPDVLSNELSKALQSAQPPGREAVERGGQDRADQPRRPARRDLTARQAVARSRTAGPGLLGRDAPRPRPRVPLLRVRPSTWVRHCGSSFTRRCRQWC